MLLLVESDVSSSLHHIDSKRSLLDICKYRFAPLFERYSAKKCVLSELPSLVTYNTGPLETAREQLPPARSDPRPPFQPDIKSTASSPAADSISSPTDSHHLHHHPHRAPECSCHPETPGDRCVDRNNPRPVAARTTDTGCGCRSRRTSARAWSRSAGRRWRGRCRLRRRCALRSSSSLASCGGAFVGGSRRWRRLFGRGDCCDGRRSWG